MSVVVSICAQFLPLLPPAVLLLVWWRRAVGVRPRFALLAVVATVRRRLGLLLLASAVLSGLARVAANVHHVQDIMAGLAIAVVGALRSASNRCWTGASAGRGTLNRIDRRRSAPEAEPRSPCRRQVVPRMEVVALAVPRLHLPSARRHTKLRPRPQGGEASPRGISA
jgi:hypothetical protein